MSHSAGQAKSGFGHTAALSLGALGVVYGDIGTSPLYAFKEAFAGPHGLYPTEANILAALSAFFWAVLVIVSMKYVWIVLRFDNEGEGGVLALTALAHRVAGASRGATISASRNGDGTGRPKGLSRFESRSRPRRTRRNRTTASPRPVSHGRANACAA